MSIIRCRIINPKGVLKRISFCSELTNGKLRVRMVRSISLCYLCSTRRTKQNTERLAKLYDDRLDGFIEPDFFEQKGIRAITNTRWQREKATRVNHSDLRHIAVAHSGHSSQLFFWRQRQKCSVSSFKVLTDSQPLPPRFLINVKPIGNKTKCIPELAVTGSVARCCGNALQSRPVERLIRMRT
jgi:hypothetical protein